MNRNAVDLDVLIVGSGVAGLSAAVRAALTEPGLRIGVLSKCELAVSATQWAQGGVAAVLSDAGHDSTGLHLADTLAAGAGLCDRSAVGVLVTEGPRRVRELVDLGAVFDRDEHGWFELAREGGHSTARVVHAGGAATGAEIERTLVDAVRNTAAALWEGWFALDLLIEGGACRGITALGPDGSIAEIRATHTLLATGGAGQLFAVTTNPAPSTGDGVAMGLRAGATVADVEFMQFHPTALHDSAMPRPLLSEALRGEGALLRDARGERFVDELSPRDVVSKAMTGRMLASGVDHLWLDATGLEDFAGRFSSLNAAVRTLGLDPARDWLPVAPAAHYLSGGVMTDLDGATTIPGLWAAGETACTGVHGANRLASNSLLEGMVFGARVLDAIRRGKGGPDATGALRPLLDPGPPAEGSLPTVAFQATPSEWSTNDSGEVAKGREQLQRAMSVGAGVLRSASSLAETERLLDRWRVPFDRGRVPPVEPASHRAGPAVHPAGIELANLLTVAEALLASAAAREESRGSHGRSDFPETSPAFCHRFVR